ncbi:MAG: hypothetical protein ACPL6D_01040 [Thermodesulfobacteriota bacterium]
MRKKFKKIFLYIPILFILVYWGNGKEVFSQPISKEREEKGPQIRFGKITFVPKEIEAKPDPLSLLEVQIEVINRSRRFIAPPNTIRVVVIPKEVIFLNHTPSEGFGLTPEESTLGLPLPPGTGRMLIIGFPLPKEKLESITFEIQINPPEGETKLVSWKGE